MNQKTKQIDYIKKTVSAVSTEHNISSEKYSELRQIGLPLPTTIPINPIKECLAGTSKKQAFCSGN